MTFVYLEIIKKSIERVPLEHESDILNIVNLIETKLCQLDERQLVLPLVNKLKSQLFNYFFKIISLVKDYIILLSLFAFLFYASIL